MQLIQWRKEFDLHIREIDAQHLELVDMLNRLAEVEESEAPRELVEDILNELSDYITYHFATEERYLRDHDYPDFESHRQAHGQFVSKTLGFVRDYRENPDRHEQLLDEIHDFLSCWLIKHILKHDAAYAGYLHERGVR
jgi:hemerythrin-like metal-binding protein